MNREEAIKALRSCDEISENFAGIWVDRLAALGLLKLDEPPKTSMSAPSYTPYSKPPTSLMTVPCTSYGGLIGATGRQYCGPGMATIREHTMVETLRMAGYVVSQTQRIRINRFEFGDLVEKVGGEYVFLGQVRAVVHKVCGEVRYVVEDDRKLLHIFSEGQLEYRKS